MAQITRRNFTSTFHHDTYPSLQSHISSISLSGKSAFITGSGTGIGAATALAFAKSGARAVFLSGRTASTLQRTKDRINNECPNTIVKEFVFDISEGLERVDKVFLEARELIDQNPIDILVNNAADLASIPTVRGGADEKLDTANFDRYWRQFEVNVKGSLSLATVFLKHAPSDGATIFNTTSGAAVIDFVPGLSGYGVSKMATLKMFTYLWYEEQDRNLRVFHIHPGIVPSAMASEGNSKTEDKAELAADFSVWLLGSEADFLQNRLLYVNWDIDELIRMKDRMVGENLLTVGVRGWDSTTMKT